jgi:hypothetical protein
MPDNGEGGRRWTPSCLGGEGPDRFYFLLFRALCANYRVVL